MQLNYQVYNPETASTPIRVYSNPSEPPAETVCEVNRELSMPADIGHCDTELRLPQNSSDQAEHLPDDPEYNESDPIPPVLYPDCNFQDSISASRSDLSQVRIVYNVMQAVT